MIAGKLRIGLKNADDMFRGEASIEELDRRAEDDGKYHGED